MISRFFIALCFCFLVTGYVTAFVIEGDEIPVEEIIKKIKKGEDLLYDNVTITGDLDLTSVMTPYPESKGVIRSDIPSSFAFVNCTFTGKIIGYKNDGTFSYVIRCMKNLAFIECEFREDIIFREAVIYGAVNFGNSKFEKQVIFTGATFDFRYNYFNECLFKDKAYFQKIVCRGNLNFMKAEFMATAYFQGIEIYNMAQFSNTKFYKNTDFSKSTFHKGCMFNYSLFSGKVIFSSTYINIRGDFMETNFKGPAVFEKAKLAGDIRFTKSAFSQNVKLNDAIFYLSPPDFEESVFEDEVVIEQENIKIIEGKDSKIEL